MKQEVLKVGPYSWLLAVSTFVFITIWIKQVWSAYKLKKNILKHYEELPFHE